MPIIQLWCVFIVNTATHSFVGDCTNKTVQAVVVGELQSTLQINSYSASHDN